jgi:hypothetical protein
MALALRRPYRTDGGRSRTDGGPSRTRVAAARGAATVGSGMLLIARLVRLITSLVALVIIVAIVLKVVGANAGNVIVKDIHDVAKTLVGPFHNVFSIKNPKTSIAANWGLAAVVWLIVGSVIASLIARISPRGARRV